MKIYFAAAISFLKTYINSGEISMDELKQLFDKTYFLESYFTYQGENNNWLKQKEYFEATGKTIFLDSGAFSAKNSGTTIDIDTYIDFILKNERFFEVKTGLDVIRNPEATMKNIQYMVKKIPDILPTFHFSSPEYYLDYYLDNFGYVALGGVATFSKIFNMPRSALTTFLDNLFNKSEKKGVKIHGFGIQSGDMFTNYPWYSCDASSVLKINALSSIYIVDYKDNIRIVSISDRDDSLKREDNFKYFSNEDKEYVLNEIAKVGCSLEELQVKIGRRLLYNINTIRDYWNRKLEAHTFKKAVGIF